jgi:hypothetical protein
MSIIATMGETGVPNHSETIKAVQRSRVKAYHIAEACHAAWYGDAGRDIYSGPNLTEAEWQTQFQELKRLAARGASELRHDAC